jgi:membrane associated rhomboid family serine protease
MVAAPVGFQCRECVAQGVAETQPKSGPIPGRVAAISRPYVTYVLVGICAVAFLLSLGAGIESAVGGYGMRPVYIAVDGQWYRLLTSVFMHWSILHIGFNMLVLIMLGPTLETVLGHFRFTVLYILAGLGGAVASYCFSPLATASVGASGAIFGLMGALIVAGRRLRVDVTQVVVLLAINLAIGFIPGGSVDWRAHVGGLVVGALVSAIFVLAPRAHPALVQTIGCLAVVAILAGLVAWRTADIRAQFTAPDQTPVVATAETSGTLVSDRINARSHGTS